LEGNRRAGEEDTEETTATLSSIQDTKESVVVEEDSLRNHAAEAPVARPPRKLPTMRIAIREQLAVLVLLTVLLALTVVSVPTWVFVNGHIADTLREGLSLTASLKASRITAELELIQTSCYTIASRLLIQDMLESFYTNGVEDWTEAADDIVAALNVGATSWLLQARIYSRNTTGPAGGALFNVTSDNIPEITLPYDGPDGSPVVLGHTELGYPTMLFPNITYIDLMKENSIRPNTSAVAAEAFPGVWISRDGGLLLGPLIINESMALISISIPIRSHIDSFILGYMTVVALADPIFAVRDSLEGLDNSGTTLIIGPLNQWNRFAGALVASNDTYMPDKEAFGHVDVQFVVPPSSSPNSADRHTEHQFSAGTSSKPFPLDGYPAALDAFADRTPTVNNASSLLQTHNEQNVRVSVGFARTQTPLVNWTIIIEKSQGEVYQPIKTLSTILLGTVFGTLGFIALLIFPCVHLGVLPIRKLKEATEKSVNPPGYEDSFLEFDDDDDTPGSGSTSHKSKRGVRAAISRFIKRQTTKPRSERDATRRMFKIPGKVDEGRHFITDELTELTRTFNDMSDELVKQYMSLDEKVAERTRQLNESKKAAEAANESKTLFIANISHELKTPLNGILGMCAVCMEDNDINRIKQSLNTVYKSGDLLLHLLEDLLSFSKNQIGAQLKMETREFRLVDVRSQILTIFEKQVREGQIDFSVDFVGSSGVLDIGANPNLATTSEQPLPHPWPRGASNLKDMRLWGDQHRILQVIINLVSNSLKFTPHKGKVQVRIKCLGEDESEDDMSRTSSITKSVSKSSRVGRARYRGSSNSNPSANGSVSGSISQMQGGTALVINPVDPKATPHVQVRERSPTPPPPNAKPYIFEFEVQDSGPGIPESMQQKVFEPFVQGDLGLSKKFGGTGLGLSICHQLAGLMGGAISLRSEQGKGTTFTMQIPLRYAENR
jgi:osomolarity two-component system, sensor histidine kinase SLN1